MADKEVINWDYSSDISNEYSVSFFYDMYDKWLGLPRKDKVFLILSKEIKKNQLVSMDKENGG